MVVKRNRRKRTASVNNKRRPVTRSRSKLPGTGEISKYFTDITVNGNIPQTASVDSELNIIAETFDDDFSVICQNDKSPQFATPVGRGNHVKTTSSDLYCYSSCTLGRNYDRSMIQCLTCMTWCHTECAKLDSEPSTTWNCHKCRCIPQTVDLLTDQMNEMHNLLSIMVEKQNRLYEQFCSTQIKNVQLQKEIESLKSQNFSLKLRGYNRLTNSSSESSDSEAESVFDNDIRASAVHTDVEQTFTLPAPGTNEDSDVVIVDLTPPERSNNRSASGTRPPPYRAKSTSLSSSGTATVPSRQPARSKSTTRCTSDPPYSSPVSSSKRATAETKKIKKSRLTVVGTSMVRGMGQYISTNLNELETCVYSTSGLTVCKATEQIPQMLHDFDRSDTVLFNVGTVDVNHYDVYDVASKYCTLIDQVKSVAPDCNIVISAIPCHLNENDINTKTSNLNKTLRLICARDANCRFIDVNPSVIAQNYQTDGLHFSSKGRRSFSQSLVNEMKQIVNFPLTAHRLLN